MKKAFTIILAAGLLMLSPITSGTAFAQVIHEKVTVTPTRTLTAGEKSIISSSAVKVLRHIAQARADIHEKDLNHARGELRQALTLIDIIRATLPTAKVKDHIWVAKKHLSYEDTESVIPDLVPIYASLDEIADIVPVSKAREHINKVREHLKKGNKKGAKKELDLADESLIFSEVDLPLSYTETHITDAQGFLAKKEPQKAAEALKAAEDGVQFVDVDIQSPMTQARKSLWKATKHYLAGDMTATKKDLEDAKSALRKVGSTVDAKTKVKVEGLLKDVEAIEGEVDNGAKETGRNLKGLYERAKILTLETMNNL
jgi:predicted  nucleic acid-binding Zn-ribbon protein